MTGRRATTRDDTRKNGRGSDIHGIAPEAVELGDHRTSLDSSLSSRRPSPSQSDQQSEVVSTSVAAPPSPMRSLKPMEPAKASRHASNALMVDGAMASAVPASIAAASSDWADCTRRTVTLLLETRTRLRRHQSNPANELAACRFTISGHSSRRGTSRFGIGAADSTVRRTLGHQDSTR